ncbi:MAG TPA: methyltransferase domain-containing protein [Steroidobacteraceae bacterium]
MSPDAVTVGARSQRAAAQPARAAGTHLSFKAMDEMLRTRLESLPGPLRILEAGCGRTWAHRLSVPYVLTGLDLDPDALAARTDLDHAIVGDLRTAEFAPHSFDVIYNAFVLEHVRGAREVLERFLGWLAPGGMLILKVPDRDSAYGFLTRFTPFWAHVMIYRYMLGYSQAGTPGHAPYPTYYDKVVSERGLREFCLGHGMRAPELYRLCSYENQRSVRTAAFLTSLLSGGRLPWRHNNLLLIART